MRKTREKLRTAGWTIFSVGLGVLLAHLGSVSAGYQKIIPAAENVAFVSPDTKITDSGESSSQYFYFTKNPKQHPRVSAPSYLVGDLDTGEVILSNGNDKTFPIASVTKLMTALVASNWAEEKDAALVSKKALATYGRNGGLRAGEKVKVSDLLYPLLLESSNDAGEVLAEHFKREDFVREMNLKAIELGMLKTEFEDPSGLSAKNQSTVLDLFKLASHINKELPELLQVTTKRSYFTDKHKWFSNNQFLSEEGYLGGKSGYTVPAGQTVVSLFSVPLSEEGARNVAITLLQSKDRKKDVENILKYLNKNIYYGTEADADTLWVKRKSDIVNGSYDQDFVTLVFGGDIMLDRGVRNSVNKNFGGDYSSLFENLLSLKRADISFANLEGPASGEGTDQRNLYSFRMDPGVIPALKGGGISIVSAANNHVGDWGRDAYTDTLKRLQENEILYAGGGMSAAEAEQPAVIEKYGMKIGFLGFSDVGPNWMKAEEDKAGILLASNPRFEEIIKSAARQVDYLVVSFHFGEEYKEKHNERQENLAHRAVDAGAKIVVGHHPHVAQDVEVYRDGFIAYSLGNFIFDQGFSEKTMQGMLLEAKLWKNGDMTVRKNTVKLNKFFQPERVINGKEERIKFEE